VGYGDGGKIVGLSLGRYVDKVEGLCDVNIGVGSSLGEADGMTDGSSVGLTLTFWGDFDGFVEGS